MEKPISLSVKAFLIRKLSADIFIQETIIESVVNHQFGSAINALCTNKSIEISGFGRFLFNDKRAIKRMEKYKSQKALYESYLEDESLTKIKRRNIELRLQTVIDNINALKPRIEQ